MSDKNNVLEFMGEDHDRLDSIFEEFKNTRNQDLSKAKALFHEFKTGLQRHIVWEEDILFPIFEQKTGMRDNGPTAVMRMEHRQIKEFLEKIHEKIVSGDSDVEGLENSLVEVLTQHNNKEESILYPWIDNEATDNEKESAFIEMQNLPAEKYNECCE